MFKELNEILDRDDATDNEVTGILERILQQRALEPAINLISHKRPWLATKIRLVAKINLPK